MKNFSYRSHFIPENPYRRSPGSSPPPPPPPALPVDPARAQTSGRPVIRVTPGRHVIPLLDPLEDNLPFALGLEILCHPQDDGCSRSLHQSPASEDVYQLHFFLQGSGNLGAKGQSRAALRPGDSLLIPPGASRQFIGVPCNATAPPESTLPPLLAHNLSAMGLPSFGVASLVLMLPQMLSQDVISTPDHLFTLATQARGVAQGATTSWRSGEVVGVIHSEALAGLLGDDFLVQGRERETEADVGTTKSPWWDAKVLGRLFTLAPDWLGLSQVAEVLADGRLVKSMDSMDSMSSMGGSMDEDSRIEGERQGEGEGITPRVSPSSSSPSSQSTPTTGRAPVVDATLRHIEDLDNFQFPMGTNRLGLAFDPLSEEDRHRTPFTFGVEVFEPGHMTPPHVHDTGFELFYIIKGSGEASCDGKRWPVGAGDVVVFRPGTEHGIDVDVSARMYCLELMLPNDEFAQFVRSGQDLPGLDAEDKCILMHVGCGGPVPTATTTSTTKEETV